MPKSPTDKISDAIDALKKYSNLDHAEAVEVLSKTLPESVSSEPLTSIPAVNSTINNVWVFFAKTKDILSKAASDVNNKIIHNESLSNSRLEIVLACIAKLESTDDESVQIKLLEKLVVDNMQLSLQHLGPECTYSGNLHSSLCRSLSLSNSDANRLCLANAPGLSGDSASLASL